MADRGERAERSFRTRKYRRQHKKREREQAAPVAPATRRALWTPEPTGVRRSTPDVERQSRGPKPILRDSRRAEGDVERLGGAKTVDALQRELRRAGHPVAIDGVWGPQTERAYRSYVSSLRGRLTTSSRERARFSREYLGTAIARESNPALELELYGMEGADALEEARQRLRKHLYEINRRQIQLQSPQATAAEPGQVAEGRDEDRAANLALERSGIFEEIERAPRADRGPELFRKGHALTLQALAPLLSDEEAERVAGLQRRLGRELAGPELIAAARGEEFDPTWATVEAATYATGPLKAVGAAVKGGKALVRGEGAKASLEAVKAGHAAPVRELADKAAERLSRRGATQSRLYYRNLLRGASPAVVRAIPNRPTEHDLGNAMLTAIQEGDFRAASTLQEELEHVYGTAIKGPQARGRRPAGGRTVKLGEHETQFPESPSLITAHGQRLLDRASERLSARATALREGDSRLGRVVGKALTPASARGRVPKQAGKWVSLEAHRRRALRAVEIRKLRHPVGRFHREEGVQMAHFWYAQMPREHRNAKGIGLVRDGLSREREEYTSGRASHEIEQRLAEIKAEQAVAREAGDTATVFDLMGETASLRAIQADIPERIKSLSENVAKLDKLAKRPVEADDEIIDSLRVLMDERAEILERAGKLDPTRAAARTGLVSRWLGLDATGEEVFLGHRLGKVRGARSSGLPGGVSTGRTRLPQGVSQRNRLQLVKTGRARQSLEAAIEDWQAAQVYEFHNLAKGELAAMGERVVVSPKPGYVLINPRGHQLPRHWKADDEARAMEEGFEPEDVLIADVEDYIENYMASGADADRLLRDAVEAGHLDDLRQVPEDVVKRYFGQFHTPRLRADIPGLPQQESGAVRAWDLVNDALYTSLIYSNPGYIPANSVANLIMAGLHQGAFLPVNLVRAGQVLTRGPQRLRDLMRAEIHHGPSVAATSETSPLRAVGEGVSRVADDPYRISALIHEAAREGIIPKTKPVLSERDYAALERFLTEERYRPLLNDVRDRAVQAMVDFQRLGPHERALAKRLLFVWSWIRGATRYPGRFALDHPARSALLIYGAAGAPGAPIDLEPLPEYFEEGMPPWLEQAISLGTTEVGGEQYPSIFPTRSISPISTPWETLGTLTSRPGAQAFGEMLNPGLRAAYNIASKEDPFGSGVESYREAAGAAGERLVPQFGLTKDLISPPEDGGIYPEDVSRLGRLKRASRVAPIAVDPEEALKARRRLGLDGDADELMRKDLIQDSREVGLGEPPPEVLEDLEWKLRDMEAEGDTYRERVKHTAKLWDKRFGETYAGEMAASLQSEAQAEAFQRSLRQTLYPQYTLWNRQLDAIIDARLESAG